MRHAALVLLLSGSLLASCSPPPELPRISPADSLSIVAENLRHRTSVDEFMRNDQGSPFRRDTTVAYTGIKWFPIDPRYRISSVLHRYEDPETVLVMGTRGEQRRNLKYGYVEFVIPDSAGNPRRCRLNVYKFTPYDGQRYQLYRDHLSVWFTDETTGGETYDVGRYVEIGIEFPDPSHAYLIDFNRAYNPYCAYTSLYSCAIPREEDRLDLALRVGEKKYHE
jgi:uncharacterized protein (DUF1684 family)